MANRTEILTQTIPRLFELCNTIREAAWYGAEKPAAAPAMKEDILAGITAVECAAQNIGVRGALAPTDSGKLMQLTAAELPDFVNEWFSHTAGPYLANQFSTLLLQEDQFSQEHAQYLTQWILKHLHVQGNEKRILLLELAQRCSAWAPEFSWKLMKQVLDSMPPEEQKKHFPHWKGEPFQPGLHPQTELKECPICGGAGYPFHAAFSGKMENFDTLFLPYRMWMKCTHCGNLYAHVFPTEFLQLGAEPNVCYPTPGCMVTQRIVHNDLDTWCNILNKIGSYTSGRSLLEVGVGKGHLIAVAQEMGYNVSAVELVESTAQEMADLLGLSIICGDFLHISEEHMVDIITMGDVIEHLQRPMEGLRKAHALLKEDGILWISTPNFESSFSKMTKVFDPMWCEPYHMTYFSRDSLLPLLREVGFELLEYQVSHRYNGSMELILRKKNCGNQL